MENASCNTILAVLLVDDMEGWRMTAKWFLSSFGYLVDSARTAEEALQLFNPALHDVVVTDNSMPGMTGLEMAHIIKMRSPSTPVLMCTGNPPAEHACVDLILQKPVHLLKLREAIVSLLPPKQP